VSIKVVNFRLLSVVWIFPFLFSGILSGQVRVRLFANQASGSAIFSVTSGEYKIDQFNGKSYFLKQGELAIISKYKGKLIVKTIRNPGFICDSVLLSATDDGDSFTLRVNTQTSARQIYIGDLKCLPDLGTLVLINTCDMETYIAGVVRAEGGYGKNIEYLKTQAVIARTYAYRHFARHANDGYNLCDNTHCQAFNGITTDSVIIRAARDTKGQVILGPDSTLIISAFHSNCGGETAPSEDVWLTGQTYLRKVTDPYCRASHNATWQQVFSTDTWIDCLKKNGFAGNGVDKISYNFSQPHREADYNAGTFSIPLRQIRSDLGLRSTYFSVTVEGDSVRLRGKGYGHGVGLCQEGAMEMASIGFDYRRIIEYYYTGVAISDIRNAITTQDK
jgi:stage II sporulation protein D